MPLLYWCRVEKQRCAVTTEVLSRGTQDERGHGLVQEPLGLFLGPVAP